MLRRVIKRKLCPLWKKRSPPISAISPPLMLARIFPRCGLTRAIKSSSAATAPEFTHAYALQGDTAKVRAAYQDFLTLWKDADPDIPILIAAKAERAKLK